MPYATSSSGCKLRSILPQHPFLGKHHRMGQSTLSRYQHPWWPHPSIPKIIASKRKEIFNLLLINHNVSARLVEFINDYSDLLLTSEIEYPNSFDGVLIRSGVNVASNPTRTDKSNLGINVPKGDHAIVIFAQALTIVRNWPRIEGYHSLSGVIAGACTMLCDDWLMARR